MTQVRHQNPENGYRYADTRDTTITIGPGVCYFCSGSETASANIGVFAAWPANFVAALNGGTIKRVGYGGTLTGSGATLTCSDTMPALIAANYSGAAISLLP
ncbi:MAG: hypothetical protein ACLQGV_21775 [Bryobacteraceae bacterium]